MTFWLLAAALCLLVAAGLWWSVRRTGAVAAGGLAGGHDLEVYRDQLAELERDRSRGLIAPAEYAAAEAEIKRRILAAAGDGNGDAVAGDPGAAGARLGPGAVLLGVGGTVAAAVAVYLSVGRPDLATGPAATLSGPTADDIRRAQSLSPADRAAMIRGMVDRLAARLKENPNDFTGWMRLGRVRGVLREWPASAEAYRQALRLKPDDAAALEGFISSRLRGLPRSAALPDDLKAAVARLARLQPDSPLALYLGGLIAAEAGERPRALRLWRRLLGRLPPESPLIPVLKRRIAALEARGGTPPPDGKSAPEGTPAR